MICDRLYITLTGLGIYCGRWLITFFLVPFQRLHNSGVWWRFTFSAEHRNENYFMSSPHPSTPNLEIISILREGEFEECLGCFDGSTIRIPGMSLRLLDGCFTWSQPDSSETLCLVRHLSQIIAYPLAITQHFWETLHPSEFACLVELPTKQHHHPWSGMFFLARWSQFPLMSHRGFRGLWL